MQIVKCQPGQHALMVANRHFVYCGRAFAGYPASKLGNYVGQGKSKEEAIKLFRMWLWTEREGKAREAWIAISQLTRTSVLGCWCLDKNPAGVAPYQCHCDVIAQAWAWLQKQSLANLPDWLLGVEDVTL